MAAAHPDDVAEGGTTGVGDAPAATPATPAEPLAETISDVDVARAFEHGSTLDLDAPPSAGGATDALLGAILRAPAAEPPIDLAPGTVVDDTFRIVRILGAGGMGVVYLARDLTLQRDVALKLHRAASGFDRLQREAIAMAQLSHPNVVTVHAVGQLAGRVYVAMEYVPGQTLRAWCDARRRRWREILAMFVAAGEGLAAAHAAGFVHRDFKPENVLVGLDGRPRVGDFGLVRTTGDGSPDEPADAAAPAPPADAALTATGAALGTPPYMAPEQLLGQHVDARADQFAFCVALHEALCGRRPFAGGTYEELRAHVTEGAPAPLPRGAAPAWVARAIRRGLARDPADRWPDLRALLAELRGAPRRRARRAAVAAVVAIAATSGGWLLLRTAPGVAPVPSCASAAAGLDEVWDPATAAAIDAHLRGVDPVHGPRYADRIVRAVDAWAARFRRVADDACRAATIDRRWSVTTAAASRRCQGRALGQTRELVARLGAADLERLPALATDAHGLARIEDCADEKVLAAAHQVPDDPATAARVNELVPALARAAAHLEAGAVAEARAAIDAVLPAIDEVGFQPLMAEAARVDGEIAAAEKRLDAAVDRFERAFQLAKASGADATGLTAAQRLIWIHGVDRGDVAASRAWILQALPEAERYGLEHASARGVAYAAAVVAEIGGDYDRAIELHRRHIEAVRARGGMPLSKALGGLGTTLDAAGRSAEAIPVLEEALAIVEQALGPGHPETYWLRNNLVIARVGVGDAAAAVAAAEAGLAVADGPGIDPYDLAFLRFNHAYALQSAGRLADAADAYVKVRAAWVEVAGEGSTSVADVDANLGLLLIDLERLAEARAPLERALAVRKAHLGEHHDRVADVETHLARLELLVAGCAAATPAYAAALDTFREAAARGGHEIPRMAGAMAGLAHCRRAAGAHREAIALLREAEPLADRTADARLRYQVAWELGWALAHAGDRAEARAALTRARELAGDDPARADDLAAIDRWLAANP